MSHAIHHLVIILAETKQILQLDCKIERAVGIGFLIDILLPSPEPTFHHTPSDVLGDQH